MTHGFKSVPFMTAGEKWLLLLAWKRFLRNGLRWEDFSMRLYPHLILHCSFIAHYSRSGFYQYYFTSPDMALKFLSQFDAEGSFLSVEYGDEAWIRNGNDACRDYYDINLMMVKVGTLFIPGLKASLLATIKESEINKARSVAEKYGYGMRKA